MLAVERFFLDIDGRWKDQDHGRVPLRIIGSTALMLQTSYERGTTDSDVLESADLNEDVKRQLLTLAGPNTVAARRHGMYLQIIREAIPFLPQTPTWHPVAGLAELVHFEVVVLDVVDVVVSKLKRLHPKDTEDIAAMIERGVVPHERLVQRFKAAIDWFVGDARGDDLPRFWANLNRIERDLFLVEETEIDLPSWI